MATIRTAAIIGTTTFRRIKADALLYEQLLNRAGSSQPTQSTHTMPTLTTARLRLEPYTDRHVRGLNALNSDPEVMRYISGRPETLEETVAVVQRVKQRWVEIGYSWWSFLDSISGEVVGAGCLQNLRRESSLHPDPSCPLEIGWRLRRDRWGQGLATEAARAMAGFAFGDLHADELYAVCEPANLASAKVMQRLGVQFRGLQRWYGRDLLTYSMTHG